jgi:hypothetical protein
VHEIEALRLHATELMMLLGTAIVLLVEEPAQARNVSPAPAETLAAERQALPAQ